MLYIVFGQIQHPVASVTKYGFMGLLIYVYIYIYIYIYIMGRKVAHMEQRNVQCENLIERNNSKQLGCRWEDNTEVDFKENI